MSAVLELPVQDYALWKEEKTFFSTICRGQLVVSVCLLRFDCNGKLAKCIHT